MYLRGVRTKAVDLFSFGVFMWELLCRERPYKGYCSDSSLSPQSVVRAPHHATHGTHANVFRTRIALVPAARPHRSFFEIGPTTRGRAASPR